MLKARLAGAAVALLIAVVATVAMTGGSALAQSSGHAAMHSRTYHAARVSVRPVAKAASAGCPNWSLAGGGSAPTPPAGTPPKGDMSAVSAGSAPPTPPAGTPASSCKG